MTKLRLAILISGRGSNLEAILKASTEKAFPIVPCLVISNRPDAAGLSVAGNYGVEAVAIDHKSFGHDRQGFEEEMHKALLRAHIDMIALAGFMRVLTPWFVNQWDGRMVNIHPSLLPKYTGLNTHQRAIDAGDTYTGCSVHWVTEGLDEGAVIDQQKLAILSDDTAETLATRLLPIEHALYPRALIKAARQVTPRFGAVQS